MVRRRRGCQVGVSGDGCKTISRDHPWMERVAAVGVAASQEFWSSMGRKGVLDFEKGPRISIFVVLRIIYIIPRALYNMFTPIV